VNYVPLIARKWGYYHADTQASHNPFDLFDGLWTLCYIEVPRGNYSAAMLFERFANLDLLKRLNRLQEAT
jgi:hypothetical protein